MPRKPLQATGRFIFRPIPYNDKVIRCRYCGRYQGCTHDGPVVYEEKDLINFGLHIADTTKLKDGSSFNLLVEEKPGTEIIDGEEFEITVYEYSIEYNTEGFEVVIDDQKVLGYTHYIFTYDIGKSVWKIEAVEDFETKNPIIAPRVYNDLEFYRSEAQGSVGYYCNICKDTEGFDEETWPFVDLPEADEGETLITPEVREIFVDYLNGSIYLSDTEGNIKCVSTTVDQVLESIMNDPTLLSNVIITYPDGTAKSIDVAIKNLETSCDNIKDSIQELEEKIKVLTGGILLTTTVKSNEDPDVWVQDSNNNCYIQQISVEDILETDYPVVDIQLSENYNEATAQLSNYANIYKITTHDGYIQVYASQPTTLDIVIIIKINR